MNEKEVVKPHTLLKEEFVRSLIDLCNNSGLPLFVMEYILRDVYLEVKNLAQKQYESDLLAYKQSQKDEQSSNLSDVDK